MTVSIFIGTMAVLALLIAGVCVYGFYIPKERDEEYEHESGYCDKDS